MTMAAGVYRPRAARKTPERVWTRNWQRRRRTACWDRQPGARAHHDRTAKSVQPTSNTQGPSRRAPCNSRRG